MNKTLLFVIIIVALTVFAGQTNRPSAANISWSSTKYKTSAENANAHWEKHKAEFPEYSEASQYIAAANEFVKNPPAGTFRKIDDDGDLLYYNPEKNIFAVKSKYGTPRTMFKPNDGIEYWRRQ